MAGRIALTSDITLQIAKQFESKEDNKEDKLTSLGLALGLDNQIISKSTSGSSSLQESSHQLINEWVNEHGNDAEAAMKLRAILTKNGYTAMAEVLKEDSKKKSPRRGHTHEPEKPPSTTDRIITYVTTVVVAALAIAYINYRDFS